MRFAICGPMSPVLRRPPTVRPRHSCSRPGLRSAACHARPRWSNELIETPFGWRRRKRRPVMLLIKTAASLAVFTSAVWWLLL